MVAGRFSQITIWLHLVRRHFCFCCCSCVFLLRRPTRLQRLDETNSCDDFAGDDRPAMIQAPSRAGHRAQHLLEPADDTAATMLKICWKHLQKSWNHIDELEPRQGFFCCIEVFAGTSSCFCWNRPTILLHPTNGAGRRRRRPQDFFAALIFWLELTLAFAGLGQRFCFIRRMVLGGDAIGCNNFLLH